MRLGSKLPPYIRRYTIRIIIFMSAYVLILIGGLTFAPGGVEHAQATLIGLSIISALPIIGVFWAVFRLLVEVDDEYQRLLFAKQTLLATGITLTIVTIWQFLNVYDVVTTGPQWMGVIWLATLGVAAPIVRWKA